MEKAEQLKKLVESLTHSGKSTLDKRKLKIILDTCSVDRCLVKVAYDKLSDDLKEEHSEVKLSSIQLINELFIKFEDFRHMVVDNIRDFFTHGSGVGREKPMPPPAKAAKEARKLCFTVIHEWCQKYRADHPILKSVLHHLECAHNVDFTIFEIVDPKEKEERLKREKKMMLINKEMLKKVNNEVEEMKEEINSTLTSLQSCFSLLLPAPDEFSDDRKTEEVEFDDLRLYGMVNQCGITIELTVDQKVKVKMDDDNRTILEAAKDSYVLIKNRFLPKTITWVELLQKTKGDKSMIKEAERQKEILEGAIRKYNTLEIVNEIEEPMDSDSSDNDFEEVVPTKPDKKIKQNEEMSFFSRILQSTEEKSKKQQDKPVKSTSENLNASSRPSLPEGSETKSRKSELLKIAPKLPFDIDLYHWEDENLQAPKILPVNLDASSIWTSPLTNLSDMEVPGGSEALRSRVIEFSGKFEPVTRACKAPLPSGRLCPRYDRVKCPLHGIIVDRDDDGNIINDEDRVKVEKASQKPRVPDWQDPVLLAELKAKTGIDLEMPKKGQRRKKNPKHPGLTDIHKKVETPMKRIAKKIFNKKAVKRVASTLDRIDYSRHRDKFGDQFNYVHDKL
ncbi:UV-stimulated scaffold protein A-like isoform X2 [Cimex lectularius]|uniref:UV-stimulated scaffold protein A C-terminal domain-containing protein n=1 Tax=Cimex lectularius TaxID=79782 RepID=A0A8I6TG86_CIMLE|nr:UV-stimulated scaffold protein A-like isoform X2 [Cimex lectularius]